MNFKIGKKLIGDNCSPYIISDIGSNHNGDMGLCKKMIKSSKDTGCDAVKFQLFSDKSLFTKKFYKKNNASLRKTVNKYSLSIKMLKEIRKYCKKIKIDFGITPLSKNEADIAVKFLKPDYLKVASGDNNYYDFINYLGKFKLPVIISTGLSNLSEIKNAVRSFEKSKNKKLAILHCVSIYPVQEKIVNLNRIKTLKKIFNYPIGFSDHSIGPEISLGAVALGANVIEKHFTTNKKLPGWDHHMSMSPNEMKILTAGAKKIFNSLGTSFIKKVENPKITNFFRKSIVAKNKIKKGQIIKKTDLDFKRPGIGLEPSFAKKIVGKRAKKNLEIDDLITLN